MKKQSKMASIISTSRNVTSKDITDFGGNSIVYRNHKVCDGLASLYDGVPSYIVLLK